MPCPEARACEAELVKLEPLSVRIARSFPQASIASFRIRVTRFAWSAASNSSGTQRREWSYATAMTPITRSPDSESVRKSIDQQSFTAAGVGLAKRGA